MSFVVDQIHRIDSQLDRLQLSGFPSTAEPSQDLSILSSDSHVPKSSSRSRHLEGLIKSLSISSQQRAAILPREKVRSILEEAQIADDCSTCQKHFAYGQVEAEETLDPTYEHELEWLLIGKAAAHAYGLVLNTILEQTLPLSDDIWYWDDILGSYRYAGLYSIQTSPLRFWDWGKGVFEDVRSRGGALREGWGHFYGLVQEVVQERSVADIQRRVLSPLALVRNEARRKQSALKRIRLINANALGVLLGEGLSNNSVHDEGFRTPNTSVEDNQHRWKAAVTRSIALMDAVLQEVVEPSVTEYDFDEAVAARTDDDRFYKSSEATGYAAGGYHAMALNPSAVAVRLASILDTHLVMYAEVFDQRSQEHGRPSRLIRYWLPAAALLVSSTTISRLVLNRKAEILTWIRELGATTVDFWHNWVLEPTKKIIGTIRHDEGSEVSILSKRSLEGDRDSLERMVVDFAIQHPEAGGLNESQIADIRLKVKEGDLTPVLKAYERDMQKPIMGAITGNLIRTLLIQIQKTKVDVEVAMSGIDSILKSQELLFGFIGLTPGVLVCFGVTRWLQGTFGNRKGTRKSHMARQTTRILRNIDRILTAAHPSKYGELFYKDHGLLLCEVHVLRQNASKILPGQILHDFLEEIDDLVDIRTGIAKQRKVLKRMRWAYARYF